MYHCIAQKQVDSQLRPDSRFLSLKKWFSSFDNWEWSQEYNELVAWLISWGTNSLDRLQSVSANWDKPLLQSSLASVIK